MPSSAGLFEHRGNGARDLQGLVMAGSGLGRVGDRVHVAEVVERLRLAKAVPQLAVEIKRVGQRAPGVQVVVGDVLVYSAATAA